MEEEAKQPCGLVEAQTLEVEAQSCRGKPSLQNPCTKSLSNLTLVL